MAPINFDYDLEEIVQMVGVGAVSLKSALKRMQERIDVRSIPYRNLGKNPSFFNAAQIEALTGPTLLRATRPATAKPMRMIFSEPSRLHPRVTRNRPSLELINTRDRQRLWSVPSPTYRAICQRLPPAI